MEKSSAQFSVGHLRALYYEYKDTPTFSFAVSALILFVNFLLFFFVVKTQYAAWKEDQQRIADTKAKIAVLEKNLDLLNQQDQQKLTDDFKVSLAGLPSDQDFLGIMTAVKSAATNSGISLDSYSFRLGNLKNKPNVSVPASVTINTTGDGEALKNFLHEIHQKIPLANIKTIDGQSNTSIVIVEFYSKSLADVKFSEATVTSPLHLPTSNEEDIINNLHTWQQTLQQDFTNTNSASESSDISPF